MSPIRIVAICMLPAAFVTAAGGFVLYAAAALPYPDPTPALLSKQAEDVFMGQMVLLASAVVFIADAIGLWRFRKRDEAGRTYDD